MKIRWEGTRLSRSPWRVARGLVFLLLLVGVGFGYLVWSNPLWLFDRQTDIRLRIEGVRSEYVTVNGHKIHYLVGGTGKPVVLVHGLGARASDWANLIPSLIHGGYRIYALDLLGYGMSDQPKDFSYSIPDEATLLLAFLDSQNLQKTDLAGWSMGGWVAMEAAVQQPQRIRRLVLLDSAGIRFKLGYDSSVLEPASPKELASLEALLVPDPPPLPRFLAMAMLRRLDHVGWVLHRTVDSMLTGKDVMDGRLGKLTMPVLIGWGDQDKLIPLEVGYQLHSQIEQSVLDIYTGCGHLAAAQCIDQVGPSVVGFLDVQPPPMAQVRKIPPVRHKD